MRIVLPVLIAISMAFHAPAQAEVVPKTLVIIDTGFDTTIPVIGGAVVQEVCILDWPLCPNGSYFQEGPGSAALNGSMVTTGNMGHGTQMASIVLDASPAQKLILVRVIGYNANGVRLPASDVTVTKTLRWVLTKQAELNIGAVAMAQGYLSKLSGKSYCPKNLEVEKLIAELRAKEVPVFLPAGNSGNKSRIDWPACIPHSIAIGALDKKGAIASYSNFDRHLTDFYAPGNAQVLLPGGVRSTTWGTSVSTLVAASYWMKVAGAQPTLTLAQLVRLFRATGEIAFDPEYRFGRTIELNAALRVVI
jgi:subtilisin family serine protease